MRLANQQLCLRLPLQVAIALFTNVQSKKKTNENLPMLPPSVETQHTIGYGGRQTTEECPEAIAVMSFQVTSFTNKQKQIKIGQNSIAGRSTTHSPLNSSEICCFQAWLLVKMEVVKNVSVELM